MPGMLIENAWYFKPVDVVQQQTGGNWKVPLHLRLKSKALQYTGLEHGIPQISQKILTNTLKEPDTDSLIDFNMYTKMPPHTGYSLTPTRKKTYALIENTHTTVIELIKAEGISYEQVTRDEQQRNKPQ